MNAVPDKELHVAIAFALRENKLLLLQRKDSEPIWDKKWEFPGGKIDQGEQAQEAIVRELREETGLEVLEQLFLGNHTHDWQLPDRLIRVHLHLFRCYMSPGEVCFEKQNAYAAEWVIPHEALTFDLLEANDHLLKTFMGQLTETPAQA